MGKLPFGMFKVKGKIDDYEFSNVRLMPFGNGNLFFTLNAKLRKKIKKEAGDTVHIVLYEDTTPTEIPEELILYMKYEEGILEKLGTYTDEERKAFVDWIYSAKSEETKVERIA